MIGNSWGEVVLNLVELIKGNLLNKLNQYGRSDKVRLIWVGCVIISSSNFYFSTKNLNSFPKETCQANALTKVLALREKREVGQANALTEGNWERGYRRN